MSEKIEQELEKLDPDARRIYLKAKDTIVNTKDSNSEQFAAASRIVRAFWRRIFHAKPLWSVESESAVRRKQNEDDAS